MTVQHLDHSVSLNILSYLFVHDIVRFQTTGKNLLEKYGGIPALQRFSANALLFAQHQEVVEQQNEEAIRAEVDLNQQQWEREQADLSDHENFMRLVAEYPNNFGDWND